ncbi:MAG: type II toxin-antitoxin system prevent-host-death family antitoxin [Acidobacteriota bacterium]
MQQVTIEQAKIDLTILIDAALKGEEVIIEEAEKAVKLVPFQLHKPRPQFGSAKGLIKVADNFYDPIEDFAEYQ